MINCRIFVVAGLGFGDEGKGTLVDFLSQTQTPKAVVRYNGGPQAAHHVVLPDGRWHCFSQIPAGCFVPGVRGHLSHSMLIKPSNLLFEQDVLEQKGVLDIKRRVDIDPAAYIVTPWDAMLGRMEEVARGSNPHGSVGMGVGKAALDRSNKNPHAVQIADLLSNHRLREKLHGLWQEKSTKALELIEVHSKNKQLQEIFQHYIRETTPATMLESYCQAGQLLGPQIKSDQEFSAALGGGETLVLEGAQGVLLDCTHGFYPHVTKTDTTFHSAKGFLDRAGLTSVELHRIGILRAYSTRHGAGPFVTEDLQLGENFPEPHNQNHRWQGTFRIGHFDLVASRYAVQISAGPDFLALTHLDVVGQQPRILICDSYLYSGNAPSSELEEFFELDNSKENRVIRAIRPRRLPSKEQQQRLTQLLNECTPHSLVEFKSWGEDKPKSAKKFHPNLSHFLSFLESEENLACPIKIASFGPTAEDKVWV